MTTSHKIHEVKSSFCKHFQILRMNIYFPLFDYAHHFTQEKTGGTVEYTILWLLKYADWFGVDIDYSTFHKYLKACHEWGPVLRLGRKSDMVCTLVRPFRLKGKQTKTNRHKLKW